MKANIEERKRMAERRIVPAGQKSNLLSPQKNVPMATTRKYSEKTKIYSPISRGI